MTPGAVRALPDRLGVGRLVRRGIGDPSFLLLVCQLVTAGVAFTVNILAARVLAPSGRGELALLLQIGYLVSLGLLLGTDRSVVAVYSGQPVRTVARATLRLLATPSTVCFALVVLVVVTPLPALGSWRAGLALALGFAVVNAFVRAVRSISIACGRPLEFLAYTLVGEVLRLLTLGALAVAGVAHVAVWMLAYVLVGLLPTAGWLVRWARSRSADPAGQTGQTGQTGRTGPERPEPRTAVALARREGLQLFGSAVAQSGMLRLDRFLLAGLASTAALGLYASVSTMTELLAWPLLAFADSRLGRWRAAYDAGELRLRSLLAAVGGYCVAGSVLVAAATSFVLVPLLGPGYAAAGDLVVPLVAAAATFGAAQILISLLIAARRNRTASVVEVLGFVVSVAAYVVLIRDVGALGAAYGSLLGYATCLLVAAVVLMRVWRRP